MFIDANTSVIKQQIGTWNILATSGGRVEHRQTGITLPVRYGYSVTVDLAANDTYTVRRILRRGSKTWIKGEITDVHAEELGDVVYGAGCYLDPMPAWTA